MNHRWYFLLGTTPQLSLLELETLFPGLIEPVTDTIVSTTSSETDAERLLSKTGGLVKVLSAVKSWTDLAMTADQLASEIAQVLHRATDKPTFGIHCFGFGEQIVSDQEIKNALKDLGSGSRFVESSAMGVSAALVLHKKNVLDLFLIKTETEIVLLQTMAVQDIDDWTNRDRHKPYADRKKGMLPPKVAKMMITIGAGLTYDQLVALPEANQVPVLYDPFCGTATVVTEAAELGFITFGSDVSNDTIHQALDNIRWFTEQYNVTHKPELFTADATGPMVTQRLSHRVDVIVTEPFLGKPKPRPDHLPGIFKGLESLYWGAFKRWKSILKPGARVAIIFPMVQDGKRSYSLESLIDKLADLGYTVTSGPVEYARSQAITRRQIYVFEYKPN